MIVGITETFFWMNNSRARKQGMENGGDMRITYLTGVKKRDEFCIFNISILVVKYDIALKPSIIF